MMPGGGGSWIGYGPMLTEEMQNPSSAYTSPLRFRVSAKGSSCGSRVKPCGELGGQTLVFCVPDQDQRFLELGG